MAVAITRRAVTILACTIASGLIGGSGIVAWADSPRDSSGDAPGSAPVPTAPPKVGEDVTIGPWAKDQPAPDLVPIDLEDGRSGFLRTYDMANGSQNPDFVRKTGKKSEETVLPVYAKDGQTVIGEFVAGTSSWE